jgi:hypothetical protein
MTLICVTAVSAQTGGTLGLFAEAEGLLCSSSDDPGVLFLYVVHSNATVEASSSWFSVPTPACATGVSYVGSTPSTIGEFVSVIGDVQTGAIVLYADCYETGAGLWILTISYISSGSAQPCCAFAIQPATYLGAPSDPDPGMGSACIAPPDLMEYPVNVRPFFLNDNATCTCTVATEQTTWSGLKALYSDG